MKSYDRPTGSVNDIRAIVIGDKVVSAMERGASNGDFRANLSQGGKAQKVFLSDEEKKVCVNASKALGLEFAGVDLMRERGKPYGKTDSCYVTEVNGNPGTGIIDVTSHNHFIDLVKYVAYRKAKKTRSDTTDTQSHAITSYPAEMVHAEMTVQQVADALLSMVMSDASIPKIEKQETVTEEVLYNAGASDLPPLTTLQQCQVANALLDLQRPHQEVLNTAKQQNILSEASTQALEMFKNSLQNSKKNKFLFLCIQRVRKTSSYLKILQSVRVMKYT